VQPPRSSAVAILTSVHEPFDPRVFHKQARALAAAGYRVSLLAPHERDETRAGVRVRGLPRPRSRTGRPLLWLRLLGRALRLRADVYHLHDPELLPLGLLLATLTGRPVVYDAHEYYRDEIATRRWLPRPLRRPAAEAVHVLETLAARRLAAVVAVNDHMAASFRARGARRVVAVHNYPPLALFPNTPRGESPPPVAVYAGLLTRERGLETVWHAGRRLRALVPRAEVRVIGRVDWAGVDPAVSRAPERWREEAATRLCGSVPADTVPDVLAGAAVGWIPFQRTPNNARAVPLKLLEYMAAGLPVVASDLGFLGQIVRREGCGLLVPPDEPEAHAQALAHLLTHPDEARALGERGRRAVEARYTWEVEAKRLLALYAQLTP
jgi:glycosyltransferase involved in cell wall biosynthesis